MKTDPNYTISLCPNMVLGEQMDQRRSARPVMVKEGFTKAIVFELALWKKSLLHVNKGESRCGAAQTEGKGRHAGSRG